ncbi:MAG: DUF4263 domain-containing protein [bacterium]|nr:DUF4263 domain-containing protein [bacterium]
MSKPAWIEWSLVEDAPAAWTWDEYESWLERAWAELLNNADPADEKIFQRFLESHPCSLPGGEGTGESFGGHHGAWGGVALAEPPIPGVSRRFPDFMWLTKNSEDLIPVLIEIEAPAKQWLTAKGDRTADLTHAEGQLAEWRSALDEPATSAQFAEMYDFPSRWAHRFNLVPRLVLIYGRRSEFNEVPERARRRKVLRDTTVDAMTYDRLRPLAGSRNSVCARLNVDSMRPRVVSVPPTFRFGPARAESYARMDGWADAIAGSDLIGDARRDLLLDRLDYWMAIGRQARDGGSVGIHSPSVDWE